MSPALYQLSYLAESWLAHDGQVAHIIPYSSGMRKRGRRFFHGGTIYFHDACCGMSDLWLYRQASKITNAVAPETQMQEADTPGGYWQGNRGG